MSRIEGYQSLFDGNPWKICRRSRQFQGQKDRKTERQKDRKTERQKINLNIWLERYNTQKLKVNELKQMMFPDTPCPNLSIQTWL